MIRVNHILNTKAHNYEIFSVTPDTSIYDTLVLLAEKNIGAVIVMENGKLVGIFSERDYARKGIIQDNKAKNTLVKDLMTSNVITVTPKDKLEDCLELMSEKHFRHLPVVDEDKVIGVISSNDVMKAILLEYRHQINSLESYISGRPG